MKKILYIIACCLQGINFGCRDNSTNPKDNEELKIHENTLYKKLEDSKIVNSGHGYDTAIFIYADSIKNEYVEYASVKYYVRNDTLYTDVPFRNLSAFYVNPKTGLPVNIKCIVYDWKKKPQKNGWYWLYLNDDAIRQHKEGSELAGLQLVGYEGPDREEKASPRKKAILWNASAYNGCDDIFDSIPAEAYKIIEIINRRESYGY